MTVAPKVMVTGAAKGIGAAIARRFRHAGYDVLLTDIDSDAVSSEAASLGATACHLNVADAEAVARVVTAQGPFDVLVNNAGIDQHAFFTSTTPKDWERLLGVNLVGTLACTHAVLPAMQQRKFGRIINIASEAARQGSKGGAVYAAAKAGVIGFTKSIARENARFGITANVVAPGPIRTPMLTEAVKLGGDKILSAMTGATLLGRLGEPDEVAAAVLFLASQDAAYITGEVLGVSGGMGVGG